MASQKSAYWNKEVHFKVREKLDKPFIRLDENWGYTSGRRFEWWHRDCPKEGKRPKRGEQVYLTYDRLRWYHAGSVWNVGTVSRRLRKTCVHCKKRVPIPLRVLFELRGTVPSDSGSYRRVRIIRRPAYQTQNARKIKQIVKMLRGTK